MGLFDSIFGSGKSAAEEAAAKNAQLLQGYGSNVGNLYGGYQNNALGALGTGLTQSTGALTGNTQQAIDALRAGGTAATGYGQQAVSAYDPVAALGGNYGRAVDMYYNALGLNGAGGTAAAQGAFTSSPGYQFQVDEATKAAANAASRLGIAGSGNTLDEIRNRAQGFAKQDYGSYLDRLGAFAPLQLNAATTAAGGQAQGYRTLADIAGGVGTGTASLYDKLGTNLAGLYTGYGQNATDVYGNVVGGQTQAQRDITTGGMQSNNAIASAAAQDSANKWNLLGSLVGAAGSALKPAPTTNYNFK